MNKISKILKALAVFVASFAFAGTAYALLSPAGGGGILTPSALCQKSSGVWAFCNTADVLGNATYPIADGKFTALNITTATISGTVSGSLNITDDNKLQLGTTLDQVMLNRSTILAADAEVTDVIEGTSEHPGVAANSLIVSNITNDGDILLLVSKAGNSQGVFWADGSTGDTAIMASSGASVDVYIAGTKEIDYATGVFAFQQATTLSTTTGALTIDGDDGIILQTTGSGAIQAREILVVGTGEGGTTAATGLTLRAPDIATGGAGNVAGADLTIIAGLGTGTGDVGTIIFQLPVVAVAGDNPQTLATAWTLDMVASATVATLTLNANTVVSGTWNDLGIVTTVDINGGTIDGATIGGASAGAGTFTSLTATSLDLNGALDLDAAGLGATITNTTDGASVQSVIFEGDRATPADGDEAYLTFRLSDSAGNQDEQARITWKATTVLDGATQDGDLILASLVNGSLTTMLTLDGSAGYLLSAVPYVLDDTSLQIQEGVDTLTITVPTLTAARAVTFGDYAGEISLLGNLVTGSGSVVLATSPTISSPVITNIAPAADFTLTQNSVTPFVSVNASAVANTLHMSGGEIGIGGTAGSQGANRLELYGSRTATSEHARSFYAFETMTLAAGFAGVGFQLNDTFVIANTGAHGDVTNLYVNTPTLSGDTGATITRLSTAYIQGAPSYAGTITNGPYALFVDAGSSRFDGRVLQTQGADVASGTNIVLGSDGNVFEITGTTKIDLISNIGWQNGSVVTLIANENVTIDDGTATSTTNITIVLAGGIDYAMTADDTLTLVLSETTAGGQAWREVARSVN